MSTDIFIELCHCIKVNSPDNLEKIEKIFKLSERAEEAGLASLVLDLSETQIVEGLSLTPIAYAAYYNNLDALKLLLDGRDDFSNVGDPSPLWCAIFKFGSKELIEYLVEKKADVNREMQSEVRCGGQAAYTDFMSRSTPLHIAVATGRVEIARLLLLHGAERYTEEVSNHMTPTDIAMQYGSKRMKNLFRCFEMIDLAKSAYDEKNPARMVQYIAAACDLNMTFFLDYLTTVTHKINTDKFTETINPHFILQFMEVFYFIMRLDCKTDNAEKSYDYFKETALSTLKDHDPRVVQNNLFASIEDKQGYLSKFINRPWESVQLVTRSEERNILH